MEKKKEELREIIQRLYNLIEWFGAYSPLATEILKACHGLSNALEEYEKIENEERE